MKKTEILDTENCAELINGLILLIHHYEAAIDRAQDESERQKSFDRMERAKELKSTLMELAMNRRHRQQLAELRRSAADYHRGGPLRRQSKQAMDRISQLDEELGLT